MQVSIINGIYTTGGVDLRVSYPVNYMPVVVENGVSGGYLAPAEGIVSRTTGPGIDRGGILWNGAMYRVMGSRLVEISATGVLTDLGDVGAGGPVSMDYSFDRLGITSAGSLFYWDGTTLTQVTDPDLGPVIDMIWVDGYFMTTDGESIVVTELNDPTAVNPLKYGSSEVDPDPIVALKKLRNEVYAINSNTIEAFDNVGGNGFPFQRIGGAQVPRGAVGTKAVCIFGDLLAFVGSGRNEALGVYVAANAQSTKISTQEIDILLAAESVPANIQVETRIERGHTFLYMHLSDRTMVYDLDASGALKQSVWFALTSTYSGFAAYRARNLVFAYDRWNVGDIETAAIGYLDRETGSHWGELVRWEFGTAILYNEGRGAVFHELELVALSGRIEVGTNPNISMSYSTDGLSWSQDRTIAAGGTGETRRRLAWFQCGHMRNWRVQRFRGDSRAHLSFIRLEARLEALAH